MIDEILDRTQGEWVAEGSRVTCKKMHVATFWDNPAMSAGESEVNATLGAASPEMFLALRAILFQVIQGPVLERDACIAQAWAAYIKAGGKA